MKKIDNPWLGQEGYNCIGCCPDNPIGLHLEFWEDGGDVVSQWAPSPDHQGWVDTLHGGVQSMLLDEVAGWVRSLTLRGIELPDEVKDEVLLIVGERRAG